VNECKPLPAAAAAAVVVVVLVAAVKLLDEVAGAHAALSERPDTIASICIFVTCGASTLATLRVARYLSVPVSVPWGLLVSVELGRGRRVSREALPRRKRARRLDTARGTDAKRPSLRGLHSLTSKLNLSTFVGYGMRVRVGIV